MKKAMILTFSTLIAAGIISLCFLLPCFSLLWQIVITCACGVLLVLIYLGAFCFKRIFKASLVCLIVGSLAFAGYIGLYYSGLLVHFESRETLQAWIESFGAWGPIMFFVIELAQVILIPIPAQITTLAGIFAFGAFKAFLISSAAIITGSIIAFAVGRALGVPVLYKVAKKETADKYRNLLSKKGRILLPIMFLFPLFPDDLLCFVAGTTTMSWLYFIVITITTRLIGVGCICAFMGGDIIPFSGWGIPVWIVIAIALIATSIIALKNQDKIEQFIINLFTKQKNKKQLDNTNTLQLEVANNVEVTNQAESENQNTADGENKHKAEGKKKAKTKNKQKTNN